VRHVASGGLHACRAGPKLASREKSSSQGEGAFVIRAQARIAPRKKALRYDGTASGGTVNTYTWNARNQLTAITQGGTTQMSYAYDAMGRRISKAVGSGTPTQFLYDGAKAVQETQGSSINPILIGPGVDERYARNDITGRTYFLSDALNSTLALTNSSGAIQNTYSYDPYGNTTQSNAAFTNPYQFMGREADTAGLYYYRARYYSPMMVGFISEDPARFAGGQLSFYAGFRGDPLDYTDPYGLWSVTVTAIDGVGGAIEFGRDPQTGQWFWGGRLGAGVEDGVSFDPLGKRPGRDETPCHGTTLGTYVEVGVTAGLWTWNPIQGAAGVDEETGDDYHEGPVPADTATMNQSPRYGFDIGGSIGFEVVHH
jgi:RHS repeat-associated protein